MNLSRSYLPPIEKGIKATMERGAFAGYPMNNVKVIVYDGKEHEVDLKPVAFEIAGREFSSSRYRVPAQCCSNPSWMYASPFPMRTWAM